MPVYFKTVYDVNLKQAPWFGAIPWGVMTVSGYVAGASLDFLIKSGHPVTRGQMIMQMQSIGFTGPGISLLCLDSDSHSNPHDHSPEFEFFQPKLASFLICWTLLPRMPDFFMEKIQKM